jgi:hypothetical protein
MDYPKVRPSASQARQFLAALKGRGKANAAAARRRAKRRQADGDYVAINWAELSPAFRSAHNALRRPGENRQFRRHEKISTPRHVGERCKYRPKTMPARLSLLSLNS